MLSIHMLGVPGWYFFRRLRHPSSKEVTWKSIPQTNPYSPSSCSPSVWLFHWYQESKSKHYASSMPEGVGAYVWLLMFLHPYMAVFGERDSPIKPKHWNLRGGHQIPFRSTEYFAWPPRKFCGEVWHLQRWVYIGTGLAKWVKWHTVFFLKAI